MKQEELLEMINATINSNGKKGITGKALNLALREIVKSMGSGGGGLMIHYLPRYEIENIPNWYPDFQYNKELQECIAHNIEIYNTIVECNNNHTPVPGPIYFDTTFFEWYFNGRERSVRGGVGASWWVEYWDVNDTEELVLCVQSFGSAYGNTEIEYIFSDGLFGEPTNNNLPS